MNNFTFCNSTTIHFGRGQVKKIGTEIKKWQGRRVLICYGSDRIKTNGLLDTVTLLLEREGIDWFTLSDIKPNPRIDSVREGREKCKKDKIDFILAIGGGSVIDTAKAISSAVFYEGDPWDFFTGLAPITKALPIACILTLAATGSEMNGNAVVSNLSINAKNAANSSLWKPRFSILDPSFTYTVAPYHTAAGIADIISHCLEQYFSVEEDTLLVDYLTEAVIKSVVHYGPIAYRKGSNYPARANLLWAGSMALNEILSVGKTGDWAVHAIEHELSAQYDITHGVGLAVIQPVWMEYVLNEKNAAKFQQFAHNVWNVPERGDALKQARAGIRALSQFYKDMDLPFRLRDLGAQKDDLDLMALNIVKNGTVGRFQSLGKEDVKKILEMAF